MSDIKWVLILEKEVRSLVDFNWMCTHAPRPSTADSQEAVITQELSQERESSSQ